MNKPEYIIDIPADDYHAATKANEYTTSHRLQLFRRCPALYFKHISGEIVEADTAAFTFGRATHTLVIEGPDKFDAEYVVADGPVNPKTNAPYGKTTKAYLDWAAQQTRPVIGSEDHALLLKMRDAVFGHDKAREIFAAGFPEATMRTTWLDEPVQIRADWYDPERNLIADLKTCADVARFQYDVRDFGYVHQLAFYAQVAAKVSGKPLPECWLVAVEKREPFRVACFVILPGTIEEANNGAGGKFGLGNCAALEELKDCRTKNRWPTRYEGFGQI